MKKIMTYGIVALLLLTSLVGAVGVIDNGMSREQLLQENYNLKQQIKDNNALNVKIFVGLINRCILAEPNKQYFSIGIDENLSDLLTPVTRHSTRTVTNTETEYIQCDQCEARPICAPYYFKYVDDGTDECGCAINPRCIEDNHMEAEEQLEAQI